VKIDSLLKLACAVALGSCGIEDRLPPLPTDAGTDADAMFSSEEELGGADHAGAAGSSGSSFDASIGGNAGAGGSGGADAPSDIGVGENGESDNAADSRDSGCISPMSQCGQACVACINSCVEGRCCGDGRRNDAEECDGADIVPTACEEAIAPGWIGTVTACGTDCRFDTTPCSAPVTSYSSLNDTGKWESYDLSKIDPAAKTFTGGAFDGRYVYFVNTNSLMLRFDTKGAFGQPQSWSSFDVSKINTNAVGFQGAAFDGRYIYFVPGLDVGRQRASGVVVRYDTQGSFDSPDASNSWFTFDVSVIDKRAAWFFGAIFDGRYVYLVPNYSSSVLVRYDTLAPFDVVGSWAIHELLPHQYLVGGTFDGRYLYVSPNSSGPMPRFDTRGNFLSAASWANIDTQMFGANGEFGGALYDGTSLYLTPAAGSALRYDSRSSIDSVDSWSAFDISTVNTSTKGYYGAVFDGRYVYYPPYSTRFEQPVPASAISRYDTRATFNTPGAWSFFDLATISPAAKWFFGGIFDGKYVYLIPGPQLGGNVVGSTVVRFEAKSPSWLPKGWKASFF